MLFSEFQFDQKVPGDRVYQPPKTTVWSGDIFLIEILILITNYGLSGARFLAQLELSCKN